MSEKPSGTHRAHGRAERPSPQFGIRTAGRRVGLIATILVIGGLTPAGSFAQPLLGSSRHFGASTIPLPEESAQLGISLDSFTEFDKRTDANGQYLRIPYNSIDETIGLNFLNYSFAVRSGEWPSLYWRASVQLGYGHDEPSKSIQDWFHDATDSLRVPRGAQRNGALDLALAVQADAWGRLGSGYQRFVGGGFTVGTTHQEVYGHLGFHQSPWSPGGGSPLITVGGLIRGGLPFAGDAFPNHGLANAYVTIEGRVRASVGSRIRNGRGGLWYALPDVAVNGHLDTGFFADALGRGIDEKLGSLWLGFADDRVVLEVWNDYFGGEFKDHGPTGGGQAYVRVPNARWPLSLLP